MKQRTKCCQGCPGWGVFSTGAGTLELQRCDACDLFESDMHAAAEALKELAERRVWTDEEEEMQIAIVGDLLMSIGFSRANIGELQGTLVAREER